MCFSKEFLNTEIEKYKNIAIARHMYKEVGEGGWNIEEQRI